MSIPPGELSAGLSVTGQQGAGLLNAGDFGIDGGDKLGNVHAVQFTPDFQNPSLDCRELPPTLESGNRLFPAIEVKYLT